MTIWQGMFAWFAAVAAGGGLMAALIALRRPIPSWMGRGHGLVALAAVAALFVVNLLGEAATPALAWWALGIFTAGLIGGLLFFRVLMPQRAPLWLALGHGSVGAIGLYLLSLLAFP
jgi:hypothetical protein